MIYGIGTDLVDPSRIARSLERYGERFARRILTKNEWPDYSSSSKPVRFLGQPFCRERSSCKGCWDRFASPSKSKPY